MKLVQHLHVLTLKRGLFVHETALDNVCVMGSDTQERTISTYFEGSIEVNSLHGH